jgi:type II secretory pathway component PulK
MNRTGMNQAPPQPGTARRRASVLITVIIIVAVLALAAYRYSDLMVTEERAADNAVRTAQTRAFADSGIQFAAAALSTPDNITNFLQSNPWDNAGAFKDVLVQENDSPFLQGRFSLVAPMYDQIGTATGGASSFRFGVLDESSKINLYTLIKADPSGQTAFNALMLLPNMTEDIADCIIDWIDSDNNPRTSGAENETYSGLNPPYQAKDGPIDSLEELLLVQNMTPQFLFGTDTNRNGIADPNEGDGSAFDPGLASYLTVYSKELNISSTGTARTNVNGNNLNTIYNQLTTSQGQELAAFIVLYRQYGPYNATGGSGGKGGSSKGSSGSPGGNSPGGGSSGKSPGAGGSPGGGSPGGNPSPGPAAGGGGGGAAGGGGGGGAAGGGGGGNTPGKGPNTPATPSPPAQQGNLAKLTPSQLNLQGQGNTKINTLYDLIGAQVQMPAKGGTPAAIYSSPLTNANLSTMLPTLVDQCTTVSQQVMSGLVNVNTANTAVLTALPGVTANNVESILAMRPQLTELPSADPTTFGNTAWLMTQAGFTKSQMQQLSPYITSRLTPNVFRVTALGYFDQGPTFSRIEAVIDTNNGRPRVLAWKDVSELGKAFDLSQGQ